MNAARPLRFLVQPFVALYRYFLGVYSETRRVTWPTWPVLVQHVAVVVVGVALFTVVVGGIDYVFIKALSFLITQ